MNSELRPTRVAGWLALIVGTAYVVFTLFVMAPQRILGQWTAQTSILGDVLSLLLAAILISAGWHELSLASKVPLRLPSLRPYVSRAGAKLSQLGATRPRLAAAVLFLIFGYAGAQFAHSLFEALVTTSSGLAWLVWALEFPVYMFVTVVIATSSGLLPQQSIGNVLLATATLFVANVVAAVVFFTFIVLWILALIPAFIASALFVSASQSILADGALGQGEPSRNTTSVMRLWGRLVLIGMPLGIGIGLLPFFRADNFTLFMPQIQLVWGVMIGVSLAKSKIKPALRAPA